MAEAELLEVVAALEGHAEQVANVGKRDGKRARNNGRLQGVPFLGGEVDEDEIGCEKGEEDGKGEGSWRVGLQVHRLGQCVQVLVFVLSEAGDKVSARTEH